ncbi:MAG: DUF3037 domain-containing protein [Thermomicrobiales bacterium]
MPPESPAEWYSYAVVRIVPRVERAEFINAGVILFVRATRLICAKIELDEEHVRRIDPAADIDGIRKHLELFTAVCDAAPEGGPIAELPADERFHWLTAPRSTIIQLSPVHEGCTDDPEATLGRLFHAYVN